MNGKTNCIAVKEVVQKQLFVGCSVATANLTKLTQSFSTQNLSKQVIYFERTLPATAGEWRPEQSVIGPDGVQQTVIIPLEP